MRAVLRRITAGMAVYAIALHTILWAAAVPLAGPSVDPFSVFCHSEAGSPAEQAPADGNFAPAHACDHCNLCTAVAPPVPSATLADYLAPARVLKVLLPLDVPRHDDFAADPKRARGPPAVA